MGCYCYDEVIKNVNYDAVNALFTSINPDDTEKYCDTWFTAFSKDLAVKYGAPAFIAIINIIVSNIFKLVAPFEIYFTKNDETYSVFYKLTTLQFINIAVVLLI